LSALPPSLSILSPPKQLAAIFFGAVFRHAYHDFQLQASL
jgi:hypothetical protein